MAELTPYQAKYLRHFLVRKYVRYQDVQLELIDHLATSIEQKMTEDENMTFDQALDQVYKSFGVGGFAKIVQEKEKSMRKFWRKHIWEAFLEFLKPPLLFLAIGLYAIFYIAQVNLQESFLNIYYIGTFAFFLLACAFGYNQYVKEDSLNGYLFYNSYKGMAIMTLYFSIYVFSPAQALLSDGDVAVETLTSLVLHYGCFYFTINIILAYILLIKIPSGLLAKFKTQYKTFETA